MSEHTRQDYERVAAMMVAVADDPKYRTGIVPVTPSLLRDWADMLSAAAERMMEWTTATPTERGWYWMKEGDLLPDAVFLGEGPDRHMYGDNGEWAAYTIDARWCRIPEPPKEAP